MKKTESILGIGRKEAFIPVVARRANALFPCGEGQVHITKNVLIYIMLKFLVNIPMKMKSIAKFKMFGFKSPMGCTLHLIGDYMTCI